MPIEPSPIPFANQQLPYTPKFVPGGLGSEPEIAPNGTIIGGGGGGGSVTGVTHGPASVAASAIIPPSPGGIAGPHRAIAALPDAGYTAPTLRPTSLTGDYPPNIGPSGGGDRTGDAFTHAGPPPVGLAQSVYAGGSLYEYTVPPHAPLPGVSTAPGIGMGAGAPIPAHGPTVGDGYRARPVHSGVGARGMGAFNEGWSASLPAPRRAPIAPSPSGMGHHYHAHHHFPDGIDDRGRQPGPANRGGHPSPRSPRTHSRYGGGSVIDDAASDASYYAMPRRAQSRHRSSSQGSSASGFSGISSPASDTGSTTGYAGGGGGGGRKESLHRRTLSQNHERSPGLSPDWSPHLSGSQGHSPISPSPLSRPRRQGEDHMHGHSHNHGPDHNHNHSHSHSHSRGGEEGIGTRRQCHRSRRASSTALGLRGLDLDDSPSPSARPALHRRQSSDRDRDRARKASNLLSVPGSVSDSEETRVRQRSVRARSASGLSRRSRDDVDADPDGDGDEGSDVGSGAHSPGRAGRAGRSGRKASIRRSEYDDQQEDEDQVKDGTGVGEGYGRSGRSRRDQRSRGRSRRDKDDDEEASPYHRPTIPIDPPPLPDYTSEYDRESESGHPPQGHHDRHRHHARHDNHTHEPRRRALSEQGHSHRYQQHPHQHQHQTHQPRYSGGYSPDHAPIPPPHAGTVFPNQSASVVGAPPFEGTGAGMRPFPASAGVDGAAPFSGVSNHPHALAHGQGAYDGGGVPHDAASAAGTAMTFMDGPIGGRVSQYGLPKYAHNPKVDYRRFCVQRGNADVFLD